MKTLIPILNHLESILNNIKTNTKTIFYNQEKKFTISNYRQNKKNIV